MHPTVVNCSDIGNMATWVTRAGAEQGGAIRPLKLEDGVFPMLALSYQQIRGEWPPLELKR
jgi:hypothetical protein